MFKVTCEVTISNMRYVILFLAICSVIEAVKIIKTCPGKPADIVFILDESNSIYIKDFEKQLLFVKNVSEAFTISPQKVRIGVITWNTRARLRWGLKTYTTKESLLGHIKTLRRKIGGRTYTHMALAEARELFREQKRPGVPHIAILMTDGASTDQKLTALEASRLQQDNITVFAIGVGKAVKTELETIASDPDESHAYLTKNYNELTDKLKNQLVASTCEIQEVKQPGECGPDDQVDMAFVLGSINQNPLGSQKAMGFIKNVIADRKLIVSPNNVQVALVPTDCVPLGFNLNTYSDKDSTMFHFDYAGSRFESTADLLNVMRDQTFIKENGARENVRQLAVVILDRASPNFEETVRSAKAATKNGIEIVCIGIGDEVNAEEVSEVASRPELAFQVKDYDELWKLRQDIIWQQVCPY